MEDWAKRVELVQGLPARKKQDENWNAEYLSLELGFWEL